MTPSQLLRRLAPLAPQGVILAGPSGKESLLCLHLALEAGLRVECAFRRDIPDGLPCEEEQTLRWIEEARALYPRQVGRLHGLLGEDAPCHVKAGVLRWAHYDLHPGVVEYGRGGWEDAARRATGLEWIIDGTRVDEMQVSFHAATMRKHQGWFADKRKVHLVWNMRIREVWAELLRRGYPERSIEITGGARTRAGTCGFGLADRPLLWMHRRCTHTPRCLDRLYAHYPDARCVLMRIQEYGPEAWLREHQHLRRYRLR